MTVMNATKLYDLPSPETIKKYTVGIKAPARTTIKVRLKLIEQGLTMRGGKKATP